ncbi:MAG: hypothetical protein GY838_13615 [bacterium]|nr:hypothetical protein [bacterium]
MFERLQNDISLAKTARHEWLQEYRRSYRQYRNIVPPKNIPWEGCANLHPPMTTRAVEQLVRRMVMFFIQDKEYVTLTANSAVTSSLGMAQKVEQFLRWAAESELDYFRFVDGFVREMVIGGTGIAMTTWCRDERIVGDTMILGRDRITQTHPGGDPQYRSVGEQVRRGAPIDQIVNEVFGSQNLQVTSRKKLSGGKGREKWAVSFKENGVPKDGFIHVDKREELGDEIEVIAEVPRLVENQPVLEFLSAEDVIVPSGNWTIQKAPLVAVRRFAPWDMVQARVKSGEWDLTSTEMRTLQDQVEGVGGTGRVEDGAGGYSADADEIARDDDEFLGVDSELFRRRMIPYFQVTTKYDISSIKGSGLSETQAIILPMHKMVARVHFDESDNRAGMRNLVAHNFINVKREFYGYSLPSLIEPLQTERNAMTNMRVDRESITGNPVMFVDHTARLDRETMTYGPGDVVRVSSPRENVLIPQWPNSQIDGLRIEQMLDAFAEDLTTIGGPSVGRSESRPNAQRTARGAQLLMGQMQFNVAYEAESVAPSIVTLWKQVHSWYSHRMPKGKEFRIFGTDEVQAWESRQELRGDFDFRFEAGNAVLNEETRRYNLTEYFQLVAPIANAAPGAIRPPLRRLALELGRLRSIKDPERFLPPDEEPYGEPLSPQQEHEVLIMGRPIGVHPDDPHELHMQAHTEFFMSNAVGLLPAGMVKHFENHLMEHRQMAVVAAGQREMGGPLGMSGNPAINAGPGQAPTTQPQAVGAPQAPNSGPGVEGLGIG